MKVEEINELMRKNLRDRFPLFDESHSVEARSLGGGKTWVGYSVGDFTPTGRMGTHFDLNIDGDICYLLFIQLEKVERGKGLGWALYEAVHGFARDFGCKCVRETPSGGFNTDGRIVKPRREYLLERGYVPINELEVELLLDN